MSKIKVTRVIEITYDNEEIYQQDRVSWLLQKEGSGRFGPTKAWRQTITVQKTGLTSEPSEKSPVVQGIIASSLAQGAIAEQKMRGETITLEEKTDD